MIHCAPLSKLASVTERTGAGYLVSLVSAGTVVVRPASISADNWLHLELNDIVAISPGLTTPGVDHVDALLAFYRAWPKDAPLLIHCWAGISRSTAATFIAGCVFRPDLKESELAWRLRWASPSATPNRRLVEVADAKLGRGGRMVRAISAIGRGEDAFEGTPFEYDLD